MSTYKAKAIVLNTYKLGEADKIIVMFSGSRGKIRGVAKGIRGVQAISLHGAEKGRGAPELGAAHGVEGDEAANLPESQRASEVYHFTLYALDSKIVAEPGESKKQILEEIEGHVLATGRLTGLYSRE